MILEKEVPATFSMGRALCSGVWKNCPVYNFAFREGRVLVQKSLLSYSPAWTEALARQYYSTHNFGILCLLDALNYILRKYGNTLVSFQCLKGGKRDLSYCHLIKLQQCLIRKRHPIRQILECTSSYKRSLNELGQESTLSKNWTVEICSIFAQPLNDNFPQWHLCFRIC